VEGAGRDRPRNCREESIQMTKLMIHFFRDEQGQDLIEYTLLMAFICLAAAALFIPTGRSITSIWSIANVSLSVAAAQAN